MSSASSTLSEVQAAIYQRFVSEWADRTPYCFDNEVMDNVQADVPADFAWVRLSIRHLDAGQRTLGQPGNRKFGREAAAFLQIFIPPDTGVAQAAILLQAGQNLFEGRTLPGTSVMFKDVVPREMGVERDGRSWGSTITAHFTYDEIK